MILYLGRIAQVLKINFFTILIFIFLMIFILQERLKRQIVIDNQSKNRLHNIYLIKNEKDTIAFLNFLYKNEKFVLPMLKGEGELWLYFEDEAAQKQYRALVFPYFSHGDPSRIHFTIDPPLSCCEIVKPVF